MADEQIVAAGLGAMNLFGTFIVGWFVIVAAAIYVTNPGEGPYVSYATAPIAIVGSLGFAILVTVFYGAEQAFLGGFTNVPAEIQTFEQVVLAFLAITTLMFVLLVTKPLADSVTPAFEQRIADPKQAAFTAYGASFVFELLLTGGTAYVLIQQLPTITG